MGARRVSSIRRSKKKKSQRRSSGSQKRKSFRGASPRRSIPPAFAAYNAAKEDAEYRGDTVFEHNGKRYARHMWDNGVSVWRRA